MDRGESDIELSPKINIPAALYEIGVLLELKKGRSFQVRAYKNAAQVLSHLQPSLTQLVREGKLRSISGIGRAIAAQVEELYFHGTSRMLERLRSELPRGALELATVPGLSLSKIELLQQELGISSAADLKAACKEGRVRSVKGFGPKTEAKLLAGISQPKQTRKETHIHKALRQAEEFITYLELEPTIQQVTIAGALRRWPENVKELSFVVIASKLNEALDHFEKCPMLVRVIERSETSLIAIINSGLKVTVVVSSPEKYGLNLVRMTGSAAHLQRLNEIANHKGLTLNLNTTQSQTFGSEDEVYESLGLHYIPPELRENEGEIEASIDGDSFKDLVTIDDVKGMVHCHTNYSDGKHTIAEMAQAAEALGMSYLTITDHSPTAFYADGVNLDRLSQQWDEIEEAQSSSRVRILRGTESDILADGSLDYPDQILEQFDVIIASIHSRYRMNEDQMTSRIIKAMRQPTFKIWGHALGRLIQHRPSFEARVEEILDVVAESKAAIEINGDPYRLDMEPRWLREARKRNIKFVISTDAHSVNGMKNLKFGVGIARRGWLRRDEILNTLDTDNFMKAVKPGSNS